MKSQEITLKPYGSFTCLWTESSLERVRGLLGRASFPPGSLMGFKRCNAVHTIGMKFPIDIFFLDKNGRLIKEVRNVKPGKLCIWGGFNATTTLEASAGWMK